MGERSIVDRVEYRATAGDVGGEVTGEVVLTVDRHLIEFVRETIPDGQMAGMVGHRPVPHVQQFEFVLPVGQARRLLDDLAVAVERAERRRPAGGRT